MRNEAVSEQQRISDWIAQNTELVEWLSRTEPGVEFGTITIRKHHGRIVGLDTNLLTREKIRNEKGIDKMQSG